MSKRIKVYVLFNKTTNNIRLSDKAEAGSNFLSIKLREDILDDRKVKFNETNGELIDSINTYFECQTEIYDSNYYERFLNKYLSIELRSYWGFKYKF